jgi:uncharacterized protein YyaL (SSP411 family)
MKKKVYLKKKPNRLIEEKSPYLLQHAFNPVNWYSWNKEAFKIAQEENKPVFVSIGYSSCHWCHVMEKESFNDIEVANLLNKTFVCVKVDKEERPDLDNVYMKMCQMMGKNCGWPLNVIMTPNKDVFFITSYIPKKNRFSIIGLLDLIPQIEKIWQSQKLDLKNLGKQLKIKIQNLEQNKVIKNIGIDTLNDAYEKLFLNFDNEYGGFGQAPKFPTAHNLLFLMRYWKRTKNKNAINIVKKTLRLMRLGGIFDQIGFGFHRYSTDRFWLVPHFEKMLYDQAMLAIAYTEVYQITKEKKFEITIKEILEYVLRELESPKGGFYTSEDADSENIEGKFYLWNIEEIKNALPSKLQKTAISLFNAKLKGNYPEAHHKQTNNNILHIGKPLKEVAAELKIGIDKLIFDLGKIQKKLFNKRNRRIKPFKDKKILVDWNGLMIAALAKAGRILDEPKYVEAAIKAGDFIWREMKQDDILYHRFSEDEAAIEGFLDDHIFLAWGFLEIYEANFKIKYLKRCEKLFKLAKEKFWDGERSGFYFSSKDYDNEVPRIKKIYDGAIPSGNSIAFLTLLRLGRLKENTKYKRMAKQMLSAFSKDIYSAPLAHTFFLTGLDFFIGPSINVTLVGNQGEKKLMNMRNALNSKYLPNVVVSLKYKSKNKKDNKSQKGKALAYICSDQICKPPIDNVDEMLKNLNA